MKYDVAIFDLDGTLLDTIEDLAASLNFALENAGLPTRALPEVRAFVGNGVRKLVERGVPAGTDKEKTEAVYRDFTEHYKLHCADSTRPYGGLVELIAELRRLGMRTAVASNKTDGAVRALCRRYFEGLFDAVAGERPGVRRKPAPDCVNSILAALGAQKPGAVYIGDSEVDIETAKNAGLDCVSVDWGFRDRDYLIKMGARELASSPETLRARLTGHLLLTADERRRSGSSDYLEFQRGSYAGRPWLESSLCLHDVVCTELGLYPVLAAALPGFDSCGLNVFTPESYGRLRAAALAASGDAAGLISELDPWAAGCLETEGVFTVCGI